MKPLNKSERRSLYLQFLLMYVISIVVIIFTMHFFYETPTEELKALRIQSDKFKMYEINPEKMLGSMHSIDSLLKNLEDPKSNSEAIKISIGDELDKIKDLSGNSTKLDNIFMKIRENYSYWIGDKIKISQADQLNNNNLKLVERNKELQKENSDLQKSLQSANAGVSTK
jgi:Type VI secretion system, TssO